MSSDTQIAPLEWSLSVPTPWLVVDPSASASIDNHAAVHRIAAAQDAGRSCYFGLPSPDSDSDAAIGWIDVARGDTSHVAGARKAVESVDMSGTGQTLYKRDVADLDVAGFDGFVVVDLVVGQQGDQDFLSERALIIAHAPFWGVVVEVDINTPDVGLFDDIGVAASAFLVGLEFGNTGGAE